MPSPYRVTMKRNTLSSYLIILPDHFTRSPYPIVHDHIPALKAHPRDADGHTPKVDRDTSGREASFFPSHMGDMGWADGTDVGETSTLVISDVCGWGARRVFRTTRSFFYYLR